MVTERETTSVLEKLLETTENGKRGFEEAAQKLDEDGRSDLAAEMREFSQQRLRFSNELRALASADGVEIDAGEGTPAGALHRGWMALKDALTGDDPHAILAAAEQGEDHAIEQYQEVLDDDLPESIRSVVARQADEVRKAHDRVRQLRDSNES